MKIHAILARMGVGIMLMIFWGLVDSPLFGVPFLLVLISITAIRYNYQPYKFLLYLEIAITVTFAFWWLPALLGLWLPAISIIESKWNQLEGKYIYQMDKERSRRLKLEAQADQSTKDSISAARLAEMTERARIAQNIHDHVGHEMHGALIALQTAKKLYEKDDPRTVELLSQSLSRLESASATLRETVHNLRPAYTIGPDTLVEICKSFAFCPVQITKSGDLSNLAHWELLTANLKELLTNTAKHSNATDITVTLSGNEKYVRLTVKDNGTITKKTSQGLGLSGMKDRVHMAGGSLTISENSGFQVVCVLPKI